MSELHKVSEELDDRALVAAVVAGHCEAFETLVIRHQDRIYTLLSRLCGCPHQATDLAQETFISAYRNLSAFENRSEFFTWLYRIACNHAAAAHRRKKPMASLDQRSGSQRDDGERNRSFEPAAKTSSVSAAMESSENARKIADALAGIDEIFRTVVVLRDMEAPATRKFPKRSTFRLGLFEAGCIAADWQSSSCCMPILKRRFERDFPGSNQNQQRSLKSRFHSVLSEMHSHFFLNQWL